MLIGLAHAINIIATPLYWVCITALAYVFFQQQEIKEKISKLLFLIFFNMPMNGAFKCLFKLEVATPYGASFYAFPSGHMQFATIFLCWIALSWKKPWFNYAVPAILALRGWALIIENHNSIIDIIGAIIAGLLVVACYNLIYKLTHEKIAQRIGFLITFICSLFMVMLPYAIDFQWASVGGALGLTIGLLFLPHLNHKHSFIQAICKSLLAFCGSGIILVLINTLHMRFFWIGFSCASMLWITVGVDLLFEALKKFFGLKNKILRRR